MEHAEHLSTPEIPSLCSVGGLHHDLHHPPAMLCVISLLVECDRDCVALLARPGLNSSVDGLIPLLVLIRMTSGALYLE